MNTITHSIKLVVTILSSVAIILSNASSINAQCTACQSYDFSITPTSSWQTSSSSFGSSECKMYQVAVTAGYAYTFKTGCGDGATADFDTYLELYDASCSYLTGNDDGCESVRSKIDWVAQQTGYVYLNVRGYSSSSSGAYTLAYATCNVVLDADFPTILLETRSISATLNPPLTLIIHGILETETPQVCKTLPIHMTAQGPTMLN